MGAEVLAGAWKKLSWSEGHIEHLGVEIDAFLDKNLRSFRAEFDGEGYLVFPVLETLPSEWPLILGDAIHSLRGALDHTMWAMVMRTSKGRSLNKRQRREIQFPLAPSIKKIETTPTYKFLDPYSQRILRDLHKRESWKFNPLRVLFEMSNEDKHRLLIGHLAAVDEGTFHLGIAQNASVMKVLEPQILVEAGDRLSNETPVARIRAIVSGPDPQVDVEGHIPGRVEFRAGDELAFRSKWISQAAELIRLTLQRFDLLLQGRVPNP